MADSVAQTILYLRPQGMAGIDVLDVATNIPYVFNVVPPPEPTDIPAGETLFSTTHLFSYDNASHDHGKISRESMPGLYY